jgi:hypothetical protein
VTDRIKLIITPNPRCSPEQLKHKKIPLFRDAHTAGILSIIIVTLTAIETILIFFLIHGFFQLFFNINRRIFHFLI